MSGLNARDVRPTLKERGFEPGVAYLLEAIIERQNDIRKSQVQLAQMVDRIADIVTGVVQGITGFKDQMEKIDKTLNGPNDDGLGPSTQSS